MERWEYMRVNSYQGALGNLEKRLNKLGLEGWEAVGSMTMYYDDPAMVSSIKGREQLPIVLLKRRIAG